MKEDKIENNSNNNVKSKTKRNIFLIIAIIIGIIAIVYSAYVLNLKPYVAELEKRDRDPARIENLSSIDSALTKLRDTNQNISWGDQNRVYISLPSYSANCSGLDLPSLPDDWEYRCKTETDYQNINGTGWIPVDFTKLPKDSVILNSFQDLLPTDPTNTSDNGYYYAYVSGENNDYVLTSLLESEEHLKKTALKDGGSDPARLEVGSNFQLWAKTSGLVGYWNFDESKDEIVKDLSGNGNNGNLINNPEFTENKTGKALLFNGKNDFVEINNENLNIEKDFSIGVWIRYTHNFDKGKYPSIIYNKDDKSRISIQIDNNNNKIYFNVTDENGLTTGSQLVSGLGDSKWHHVFLIRSNDLIYIYEDGILKKSYSMVDLGTTSFSTNWIIGKWNDFYQGEVDELRIYNRALEEKEIQTIYNRKIN